MVRRIELPGIGTKYELETKKGDKIAIVFLFPEKVQLYLLPKSSKDALSVEMNVDEARRLGNILFGATMKCEKERIEVSFSEISAIRLMLHTYRIGKNLDGKSIEDLQIRKRAGVTVIAVSRNNEVIVNPLPSFTFKEGDKIVVVGEKNQIEQFEREILEI
ncbi:MAG: potassium transporter TrkA [Archaeoglobaceae archaeon]|nr:potassium transporter TrkA [Archaeoglobaceae archaeon]MCX8152148.1 potassium transporter TrkA [Archaeoglobaceae archaeon]MDW8013864.1 TrkA C-terminal domain-containing protein [Archaeoglobaceae archaeon]